jgi:hypothetical protein
VSPLPQFKLGHRASNLDSIYLIQIKAKMSNKKEPKTFIAYNTLIIGRN